MGPLFSLSWMIILFNNGGYFYIVYVHADLYSFFPAVLSDSLFETMIDNN